MRIFYLELTDDRVIRRLWLEDSTAAPVAKDAPPHLLRCLACSDSDAHLSDRNVTWDRRRRRRVKLPLALAAHFSYASELLANKPRLGRNSHGDTDREALQEGGWISDHIMDVYYTYLENEVLSKSQYRKHHIYLVRATMAYYIRHQNEVESLALTLPGNLNSVRYIFFPINDNDDPSGHGGSHWSLLVVNVPIGLGFHYDSLGDRNDQVAKLTLGKISALLSTNFRYYRQPCPQQANFSDCGIHVLYNTRVLISRILYPNLRPNQPWGLSNLNPDTAKNRRELRDLYERIIHSSDDSNVEPESG